jgi:hypothetical protein
MFYALCAHATSVSQSEIQVSRHCPFDGEERRPAPAGAPPLRRRRPLGGGLRNASRGAGYELGFDPFLRSRTGRPLIVTPRGALPMVEKPALRPVPGTATARTESSKLTERELHVGRQSLAPSLRANKNVHTAHRDIQTHRRSLEVAELGPKLMQLQVGGRTWITHAAGGKPPTPPLFVEKDDLCRMVRPGVFADLDPLDDTCFSHKPAILKHRDAPLPYLVFNSVGYVECVRECLQRRIASRLRVVAVGLRHDLVEGPLYRLAAAIENAPVLPIALVTEFIHGACTRDAADPDNFGRNLGAEDAPRIWGRLASTP